MNRWLQPDICCNDVDIAIGVGTSWPQAVGSITWLPTDVLAIGVSTTLVGMVLLGSYASTIIRSSPVPALTVPRSMAEV
ncbi:hypothetical protein [Microlunatus ginsengisoli]|uniref:Uncharacterized protein n=1 Tax=Microlunatus ginsengisoli TaxID=363863 RepID=A0ABP7AKW2_9ACTN